MSKLIIPQNFKDLVSISNTLNRKASSQILRRIIPVNFETEKRRFFSRKYYDPQFRYRKFSFETAELLRLCKSLKLYSGRYSAIVHHYADRMEQKIHLLKNVSEGKNIPSRMSKIIYGYPSTKTIGTAKKILTEKKVHKRSQKKEISAREAARLLKSRVKQNGWEVKVGESVSRMKVDPATNMLIIKKGEHFSKQDIKRLIVHEIGTHIRRKNNHDKLKFPVKNMLDYLETEEGLAYEMESRAKLLTQARERIYAGRTIAAANVDKSFTEIYKILRSHHIGKNTAFNIATRVKRGTCDTSKPGGFTRDHIYLTGKLKIDKFIEKGGNIKDLFIGKIGVEHLKYLKR